MASASESGIVSKTPLAHELVFDGHKCYFYGSGEKAVIVYHDIFGYDFWLARIMCEQLANAGYFVAVLDIYDGDAWGLDQDMGKDFVDLFEWMKKCPWHTKVKGETHKVIEHMKSKGAKTFGCLGFCSGAYFSFQFCCEEEVKGGIAIHPSAQISDLVFGESCEELTTRVKCPHYICTTVGDSPIYSVGGRVYEILDAKFGERNHHKFFADSVHGFVKLGGESNDNDKLERDVKLAMEEAIVFLNKTM